MRDYLTTDTGDLLIQNGDFVQGDARQKAATMVTRSPAGFSRRYPLIGVGAADYKNALVSKLPGLVREINLQLEAVGFKQASVSINEENELEYDV